MRRARFTGFLMLTVFLTSCSVPLVRVVRDPLSAEEHLALGVAYEERGEFEHAVAQYELAAEGNLATRAELYLGNAWYGRGDLKRAEAHYRTVLVSDPECSEAMNNLAWVIAERGGDLHEAAELARRALGIATASGDHSRAAEYRDTLENIEKRMRSD